jgi:predicted MFS family arabinose efflux permease
MLPNLIGQIGLAFADSASEIVAFRTLTGFGYAIVTLACQDYVLDVTTPGERSRALALFTLVLFGGVFSGTALGGVLADRLGFAAVFLISAGLIAAAALLALRFLPARDQAAAVERSARLVPPLLAPMRDLRFAGLVLGIAIPANILVQAFMSYLVALVLDSLGASAGDIGRTLMSYFVVVALVSPPVAQLAENRLPPALLALLGGALSGVALLPAALWPSTWTMLLGVVLAGLGHTMVRGPQVSVALEIAEGDLSHLGPNAVLAALRTLERGGSILGLVAIAAVAGAFGTRAAMLAVAVWVLGGAVLFLACEGARIGWRARAA